MRMQPGITKLKVIFLIVLVAVLAGLTTPAKLKASRVAAKAQATNNAKDIGIAMNDFVEDFGSYPSEDTKQQLIKEGAEVIPEGNDANAYLAQLLASGAVDSEKIFYVKGFSSREGDDIFGRPEKMLAKRENDFGYVMLNGNRPLSSAAQEAPVIVAPLLSRGADPRFDPKPFNEQYIYLTPDGSVQAGKISEEGIPIAIGRGKAGLFGADKNSGFGKDIPNVKMPR